MTLFDHNLVRQFIQKSKTSDLRRSIQDLLQQLKITKVKSTSSIPQTGPVLLISNHHGGLDSFALISSLNRNDFYFIAIASYQIFGQILSKHLLPIFHTKRLNTRVFEYPRDILGYQSVESLNQGKVNQLNRQTISRAAQMINQGHLVSIFPTGKYGKSQSSSTWKIGLGYLVQQIRNPQTLVIFVKIKGTASHDFLRFLHPFGRNLLFKPKKIDIIFSAPILLTKLVNKKDQALNIIQKLEKHYQEFVVAF